MTVQVEKIGNRNIYYVDVGSMPQAEVAAHLERIKSEIRSEIASKKVSNESETG